MPPTHELSAFETKRIRGVPRRRRSDLDDAPRRMPDSIVRRGVIRTLEKQRAALVAELTRIRNERIEGTGGGLPKSIEQARAAFTVALGRAMQMGHVVAGLQDIKLDDHEVDDLAMIVEDEIAFFKRFLREWPPKTTTPAEALVAEANEAMLPEDRLGMYGGAVFGGFWRGWLASLPSNAIIWWQLSISEHCGGCITLHANNPYTLPGVDRADRNPLPTVPKNSDTPCLTNCRCFLESVGPFSSRLFNSRAVIEVTAVSGRKIDAAGPEGRAAAALYTALVEGYAYARRLEEIGVRPAVSSRAYANQIAAMAGNLGHTVRFGFNDAELLAPVRTAQALGMKYVPADDLSNDLLLAIAVALTLSDGADRGQITDVDQGNATITLENDPNRRYRVDEHGKGMLFVE